MTQSSASHQSHTRQLPDSNSGANFLSGNSSPLSTCISNNRIISITSSSSIYLLLSIVILLLLLLPSTSVTNCDILQHQPTSTTTTLHYGQDARQDNSQDNSQDSSQDNNHDSSTNNNNSDNNHTRTTIYPPANDNTNNQRDNGYATINQFSADRPSASTTAYSKPDPVAVALASRLEKWFNENILTSGVASNQRKGANTSTTNVAAANTNDNGEESNMGQVTGRPPSTSPISNYANDNVYDNYNNDNNNTRTNNNGDNNIGATHQHVATATSTNTLYDSLQPNVPEVPSTKKGPQFIELEDTNVSF